MFAVGAAHYCVFADLHAVGYKSSLDNRAGFHFHAGHQDAVDNLGAFTYCRTGKEYGVGNFAFYDTALSDECLVDLGVRSDILRKGRCIFRVDLPGGIVQVKLVVAVQKIHICFPEGIDGSYIFPVAFIFVCYQSFSICQKIRDDVFSEIVVGIRIFHICQEHLAQKLPVENIDTHGGKIALLRCVRPHLCS